MSKNPVDKTRIYCIINYITQRKVDQMNQTTQIRKIVQSYLKNPSILMFNDKRKDGTRRLKFVGKNVDTRNRDVANETINQIKLRLDGVDIIDAKVRYASSKCVSTSTKYTYLEIVYTPQL